MASTGCAIPWAMNEGVYRVLRALGDGKRVPRAELTARSGEAPSVVRELLEQRPSWFDVDADGIRCTRDGLAALGMELHARAPARSLGEEGEALLESLRREARGRGRIRRDLDQVWATLPTVVARAQRLVAAGETQRGLAFLGDDDLTSLALHLLGVERKIAVFDLDEELLAFLGAQAEKGGWEHEGLLHDLRKPVPAKHAGRYGCVFTDPPYAPEGFALFLTRAVELLKPDGRLYVCFGWSRRASERGLEKQRLLADAGFLVEEVVPDFNAYEGAESIGSHSALWIARVTPQTRPLVDDTGAPELYTRRRPRRKKRS